MELFIIIIIGFLIFVLPELLKQKKQQYEYPKIPEPQQPASRPPLSYQRQEAGAKPGQITVAADGNGPLRRKSEEPVVVMPADGGITLHVAEESSWAGQLDLPRIVNGVIFAELLQPPRAKRPISRRWKK